jgi:hypothetical protein
MYENARLLGCSVAHRWRASFLQTFFDKEKTLRDVKALASYPTLGIAVDTCGMCSQMHNVKRLSSGLCGSTFL